MDRPPVARARWFAFALAAAIAASAVVAALPTFSLQVAVMVGGVAGFGAVVITRLGWVLNPAWILVIALYLIGPVGSLVRETGIGLPTVALLAVAPIPFVLGALVIRPEARSRIPHLAPLAFLAVLAAGSLVWSSDPAYGAGKLTIWALTGLAPAAFIVILAPASSRVLWAAIAVAAFLTALALIAFGGVSPLYPGRLSLFDDNPIWTARAAFIGALVATFGPFPPIARLVMAPVLVLAGLLTVSMGPLLGLLVGGWAALIVIIRQTEQRNGRQQLRWIGLGMASGLVLVFLVADSFFGGDGSILSRLVVNDPNVTGRATFLDAAFRLFLGSPALGVGLGGFAATGLIEYPHNLVAEIGTELGIVGLLGFVVWVGFALRGASQSPLLTGLLVATGVYAFFSGSVASNAEFWMISALAVSQTTRRARSTVPGAASVAGAAASVATRPPGSPVAMPGGASVARNPGP